MDNHIRIPKKSIEFNSDRKIIINSILKKINSINIGQDVDLIVNSDSHEKLVIDLKNRMNLARNNGIELKELFEIEFNAIKKHAKLLAEMYWSFKPENTDDLNKSDLFLVSGIPGEHVKKVEKWFYSSLLRHERQVSAYFSHLISEIGGKGDPVVSKAVVSSRRKQIETQEIFENNHVIYYFGDDGGKVAIPFSEVSKTAKKRSSKTYLQIKGIEGLAEYLGLEGYFVTLTLPSNFHPNPSVGAQKWDGCTPKDGHMLLQKKWRNLQKILNRNGGKFFGVRVVEPHRDGCPHWHVLIYIQSEREKSMIGYIAKEYGDGPAVKIVKINRDKGSASSYLMKYINPWSEKNAETSEISNFELYDAYRATWGGRAIQFFDIPGSATVWDQLRLLKKDTHQYNSMSSDIACLYQLAISNKYGEFLCSLWDMNNCGKKISILYASDQSGPRKVVGLKSSCIELITKKKEWFMESRRSPTLISVQKMRKKLGLS